MAIPDKLVKAASTFLIVVTSQAGLGSGWDVFGVVAGRTRSDQLPTFEVPVRGRGFPVAHVDDDRIRLCERDGKSCCEDLEDKHRVLDLVLELYRLLNAQGMCNRHEDLHRPKKNLAALSGRLSAHCS